MCKNFERVGFVKESFENGHLVYRGTGSDKDMSYFALIISALVDVQWFKKCVKTWFLIVPERNTFDYQDCIEPAVKRGFKGFTYGKSS